MKKLEAERAKTPVWRRKENVLQVAKVRRRKKRKGPIMRFHTRCICGIEVIVRIFNPKDMDTAREAGVQGLQAHIEGAGTPVQRKISDPPLKLT